MIKLLARRWLRNFSQRYQYDTDYMTAILEHSPAVLLKYSAVNLLSSHRRGIPPAPWWTSRIRAALWEDCGPCVQLVCNMAIEAEIHPRIIAAVAAADLAVLDDDCVLALQFTESVLARNPVADTLRERVRRRWGEDGLISLAMTISTTRVYPGVKYALGYGHSCSRVQVAQRAVTPAAFQSATLARTATGELS